MSLWGTYTPCDKEHRAPQGPNEDTALCECGRQTFQMRPEGETYGLHLADCSLPERHQGYCEGGGSGHPPAATVRGFWPGMESDIHAERARFTYKILNAKEPHA